jgi:tripartite-type tricarboxylate transporter receptor subunit TctC
MKRAATQPLNCSEAEENTAYFRWDFGCDEEKMNIRRWLCLMAAAGGALCLTQSAFAVRADAAADYPNKPIRFIVPFSPGAGTDATARLVAEKISVTLGQQVVADNRTGAAGSIGVDLAAKAPPDGYTICFISGSHAVDAATNPKLPYDLTRDLQPIMQFTTLFYVLSVNPTVPAKSVKELIAMARQSPGKLNFGSSGTGGLEHMAGELFKHLAGVNLTHVPYKGAANVVIALLSNDVQIGFTTNFSVRPHVATGRLRVLAITAANRSPALPDTPTIAEAGVPGYRVDQWYGAITGAKVPRAIVMKLNAAMADAMKAPDLVKRVALDGSTPVGSTPEQFGAHIKSEIAKWRKLEKDAGLVLHQ